MPGCCGRAAQAIYEGRSELSTRVDVLDDRSMPASVSAGRPVMKSLKNLADRPAAAPLMADDILEFHAGRLREATQVLMPCCGGASTMKRAGRQRHRSGDTIESQTCGGHN